jgi:aspartate carbamoyltransferase catalytic subunit
MAIRGPYNPEMFRNVKIPVLNAMMGDDHTIAAIWNLYNLWKRFGKLEGLKIGAYGLIRYSRPIKSFYRIWSKFGMKFYENSIIDGASSQKEVIEEIKKNGSVLEKKPLEEIMKEVDLFIVAEALPQKGADTVIVNEFNSKFKTIDEKFMENLNSNACWEYIMPRMTTDGRLTTSESLDNHPKNILPEFMRESVYVNIGMFYKLLQLNGKI